MFIMKVHKVWSCIRKYQRLGFLDKSYPCMLSPSRCFSKSRIYDSDCEDYRPASAAADKFALPCDVPQGYLAVYVGPERLRFLMKTQYVNHPLFRKLLDQSEEEFGFNHNGGLTVRCEVLVFENLLWHLGKGDSIAPDLTLGELFSIQGQRSYSESEPPSE